MKIIIRRKKRENLYVFYYGYGLAVATYKPTYIDSPFFI